MKKEGKEYPTFEPIPRLLGQRKSAYVGEKKKARKKGGRSPNNP